MDKICKNLISETLYVWKEILKGIREPGNDISFYKHIELEIGKLDRNWIFSENYFDFKFVREENAKISNSARKIHHIFFNSDYPFTIQGFTDDELQKYEKELSSLISLIDEDVQILGDMNEIVFQFD